MKNKNLKSRFLDVKFHYESITKRNYEHEDQLRHGKVRPKSVIHSLFNIFRESNFLREKTNVNKLAFCMGASRNFHLFVMNLCNNYF